MRIRNAMVTGSIVSTALLAAGMLANAAIAAEPVTAEATAVVATQPATQPTTQPSAKFGADFKLTDKDNIPVKDVLTQQEKYNGKFLRIAGTVGAVCEKKGCWLTVTDGESKETVFIKFKDPGAGRLIPLDAVDQEVVVEGTYTVGEASEAFTKHIRECQGATKEELDKIVGPQKIITFKQPAVLIKGVEQPTTKPAIAATEEVEKH